MRINRSYKYRIYPNKYQKESIELVFEYCSFVRKLYIKEKAQYNKNVLIKDVLKSYKERYPYLKKVDSLALMNVMFKVNDEWECGNLASKPKTKKSYTTTKLDYCDSFYIYENKYIYLPKVGNVIINMHRPFPMNSKMKNVTIIKEYDEYYYASILFEIDIPNGNNNLNLANCIGIDYSSTHFAIDSNGISYDMPHFYRRSLDRIYKKRKELDRMQVNSNNYIKKKKEIMKLHKRIRSSRKDYLHKLSSELANEYDYICVEDINLSSLVKKSILKNATKDNSYGEFVKMLEYKMNDRNKKLLKVDRWYPSSKICHICGWVNNDLTIETKQWICKKCNAVLDRDINAAINIKNKCLDTIAADWSVNVLEKGKSPSDTIRA